MKTRQHFAMFIRGWRSPALVLSIFLLPKIPLVFFVVNLMILFIDLPGWIATVYELTDDEVIIKSGWFFTLRTYTLKRTKVETTELHRSVSGLLLGYGVLEVIGTGGSKFLLHYVPRPDKWFAALNA
jgi:uncharacterized membrane protein YdbT with pleckstrin-like domain